MIKLVKADVSAVPVIGEQQQVWPLKVDAFDSDTDAAKAIFVYSIGATEDDDMMVSVASVPQLAELSATRDPDATHYLRSTLQFDNASAQEAAELWEMVQNDTRDLVANIEAAADLLPSETVEY